MTVLELIEEICVNPEEMKEMVLGGELKTFSILSLDQELTRNEKNGLESIIELIEDNYSLSLIEAGTKLGIQLSEIKDCFLGEFDSDEEFLENHDYFGFLYSVPLSLMDFIDYDKVTKELMREYMCEDGFYFR